MHAQRLVYLTIGHWALQAALGIPNIRTLKVKEAQKWLSCLRYITANALHTSEGCVLYIMMAMGYNFIYMMDTAKEISEMSAAQLTATCHHHPITRFSSWRNQLLWSVFIHMFYLPSFSDFNSHRSWHNVTRSQIFCYRSVTFHKPFTFTIYEISSFSTTTFCDEATSSINTWSTAQISSVYYRSMTLTIILLLWFIYTFCIYFMELSMAKIDWWLLKEFERMWKEVTVA